MRQVPELSQKISNQVLSVFSVVALSELASFLVIPLLAFLFFSDHTPIFLGTVSHQERSLLYGVCIGLGKLCGLIGFILMNPLTDSWGRKLGLYGSQVALIFLALLGGLALIFHRPGLLILGFMGYGLFYLVKPTGIACVADVSRDNQRLKWISFLQAAIALGVLIGSNIGGQLAEQAIVWATPYLSVFMITGCIALLATMMIFFSRETLVSMPIHSTFSLSQLLTSYFALLKDRSILRVFCILILAQLSWATYFEYIQPILQQVFHYTPAQMGLFVSLIAVWLFLASIFLLPWLGRYYSDDTIIRSATMTIILGLGLTWFASYFPQAILARSLLWLMPIPIATGDVMIFSILVTYLLRYAGPAYQAKIMGLNFVIITLVWSITGFVGAWLFYHYQQAPLIFAMLGVTFLRIVFGIKKKIFD